MRLLRVRGRSSGRFYAVSLRIATWERRRYVPSILGRRGTRPANSAPAAPRADTANLNRPRPAD